MHATVVLATRNRADLLAQTLAQLGLLDVKALSWGVIVVDNGSTDETPQVLRSFEARLPLRVLAEPRPGKNRALNRALVEMQSELWVFTDDDVLPARQWLSELVAAAARWPHDAIFGGPVHPVFPPDTPEWLCNHRYAGPAYARFVPEAPEGPLPRAPFGPNFAVRASAMSGVRFCEDVGPSSREYVMGGETELLERLMRAGHRVIYVPDAEVGHVVRREQTTPEWVFRRAYSFGRGAVRSAQADGRTGDPFEAYAQLLVASVSRLWARRGGPRARLESGALYHYWRGVIHERRRIRGGPGSDAAAEARPAS